MKSEKLLEIDNFIEDSINNSSDDKYLSKLAKLIIPFLNIENRFNIIDSKSLIKREMEQNNKRFISFCLLRVYSKNSKLIINSTLKHNIHTLFFQSVPEVCRFLNLNEKVETYKVENKVREFVKTIESEIEREITKSIDLKYINIFGKNYRTVINKKINRQLLDPFFGDKFDRQLIDKAFRIIQDYGDGDLNQRYLLFKEAKKVLESIIEASKESGTKYSVDYICKPFSVIINILKEDFEKNPNAQPASLQIKNTEKKYPFIRGMKHNIQLLIENDSTGYADDTNVIIDLYSDEIIELYKLEQYVGVVKRSSMIEFEYNGIQNADSITLIGEIEWKNFNKESCKKNFEIELIGQRNDINWSKLESEEPYDLEPVTDKSALIGRKKIINGLSRIRKKLTSSYIFGQRRVGKTSIVKTLQSIIKNENILPIYIEAGDWDNANSPHKSMDDLARKICIQINKYNIKFSSIKIPDFDGSLNRLTEFLDEVTAIDDTFQALIILDEFDRISSELLYQGKIAQSFMLTIRSISNRDQFGFILVGGEKLEYILSQWQEFNKFRPIRIDYFDKESEWEDFKNLIRMPVKEILEISDIAIDFFYKQTSGNPYFTKKICIELFQLMVSKRDNHVTEIEAKLAVDIAGHQKNIGATDFSHFWKDGIKEKEKNEEEISVNRRKVLLSIGQLLANNHKTTKQQIIDKSMTNGLSEFQAKKTLEEFVQRKIIEIDQDCYKLIVKFFEDWLINNGLYQIITTFQEEQSIILRQRHEEELRIKHGELNALTQGWKSYKGKEITTDCVREWLEQFEDAENQRYAFKLLENIKFYTNNEIREKTEELFIEVKKEIRKYNEQYLNRKISERKISGIIVSYLDSNPVKSGSEYAKIFVEKNNIYKGHSTVPEKIFNKINEFDTIAAIVFIDDFIGTGNSVIENLKPILSQNEELFIEKNIIIIIGAITGFLKAKHKIEEFTKKYKVTISLKILVPLDNKDKCFDHHSSIYPQTIEREKAFSVFNKIGQKLEPKHPLGYGNCQATVVFPNTCPNNTLPILWKETRDWKPIFKRG
ncbi:MAG: ATP-binding protein [Desulfobacteraceae bacterium]|nr:ATP-binding protein [Desulfobacteraceae bacterium]